MHIDARRLLTRDPWFMTGMVMLTILTGAALVGPVLVQYDPHDISFMPLDPPSVEHLLGVNDGGMDILSELLYGLRNTLLFGLCAGSVGLIIGVVTGLVSGNVRRVD